MIFDLDSTHSDTYGEQEKTDYNTHYQTNGYHPQVAFDCLTWDFLKADRYLLNLAKSPVQIDNSPPWDKKEIVYS